MATSVEREVAPLFDAAAGSTITLAALGCALVLRCGNAMRVPISVVTAALWECRAHAGLAYRSVTPADLARRTTGTGRNVARFADEIAIAGLWVADGHHTLFTRGADFRREDARAGDAGVRGAERVVVTHDGHVGTQTVIIFAGVGRAVVVVVAIDRRACALSGDAGVGRAVLTVVTDDRRIAADSGVHVADVHRAVVAIAAVLRRGGAYALSTHVIGAYILVVADDRCEHTLAGDGIAAVGRAEVFVITELR